VSDVGLANSAVYRSKGTVKAYVQEEGLQLAEQSILKQLKDRLASMTMLDLGVGGGRTTIHFAPLVKKYTGIDYSEDMIKACQKRFPQFSFEIADARSMASFKNAVFDFILFSYNGIDYVSHEDRGKVLLEVKRVGKQGGSFCFSTHNLGYVPYFLKIPLNKNVFHALYRRHQANQALKKKESYTIIRDGGENFKLQTYYIKPSEQINRLKQHGFSDIRIFSEKTGQEITDLSGIDHLVQDRWLYYLCQI
jgi:ubiquinone/menaquinone biosynthesis C-methylase UbiE